jgi:16S rRNA (adenine1518-N6/adenine1519-N6)-dimethyltransferase
VAPAAFDPPPRVNSAVLRMAPHRAPAVLDAGLLSQIVTVAFSQRRKLLRHTLGRWLEQAGAQETFDLQRRAEEVAVDEFVGLAQRLGALRAAAVLPLGGSAVSDGS